MTDSDTVLPFLCPICETPVDMPVTTATEGHTVLVTGIDTAAIEQHLQAHIKELSRPH